MPLCGAASDHAPAAHSRPHTVPALDGREAGGHLNRGAARVQSSALDHVTMIPRGRPAGHGSIARGTSMLKEYLLAGLAGFGCGVAHGLYLLLVMYTAPRSSGSGRTSCWPSGMCMSTGRCCRSACWWAPCGATARHSPLLVRVRVVHPVSLGRCYGSTTSTRASHRSSGGKAARS